MVVIKPIIVFLVFCLVACQSQTTESRASSTAKDRNDSSEKIYDVVEEMPYWGECVTSKNKQQCSTKALLDYLYKNLVYEAVSDADYLHAQIVVRFVIEKDGSISTLEWLKNEALGKHSNLMELLKEMPKWKPGKLNGKVKRVKYILPIRVRLE